MAVDIKLWRDRLMFSRRIMEKRGLIGSSSEDRTLRTLIKLYGSDPESHLPLEDWFAEEGRTVSNKIFQVANQMEAEVAATRPEVQLLPRGGIRSIEAGRSSLTAAMIAEPLINYDIDELEMDEQLNDVLLDHMVAPVAWARAGFTPREEVFVDEDSERKRKKRITQGHYERPDSTWIQRVAPWDVLPDPNARRFTPDGGMKWVAFRSIEVLDSLKKNPAMKNFRELDDLAGQVSHPFYATDNMPVDRQENPDNNKFVEVYTVYEAEEDTWFQLTLDGPEKLLREQDDWPIPWEWLPVRSLVINRQRHEPWGIPLLKPIMPIQMEINRLRTMMSWIVRNTRRLVGVNKDQVHSGEARKIENAHLTEVIWTKGEPNSIVQQINTGGFPQELLLYEQMLNEDIREMLGLSRMGRGQRINVETATEAQGVQSGQDINVDRITRRYERFWKEVLRLHIQGRRHTFSADRKEVLPLLGRIDADGLQAWAEVDKETLQGDFDFSIVRGSTRRRDRAQEEAQALVRLQVAIENPEIFSVAFYAMKLAQIQGVPPEEAMQMFAQTASAAKGIGAVRDMVNPEADTPQPGGQGLALALSGGGGTGGQ